MWPWFCPLRIPVRCATIFEESKLKGGFEQVSAGIQKLMKKHRMKFT